MQPFEIYKPSCLGGFLKRKEKKFFLLMSFIFCFKIKQYTIFTKSKLLFLGLFFISTNSLFSFTLYSRVSTGFYTSGTWSKIACGGITCGCSPLTGDDIVICAGYTVTLPIGSITIGPGGDCASITIKNGGTLNMLAAGTMLVKNGGVLTIETGGNLLVNGFTNQNNSDGVVIDGTLTLGGLNPVFSNGVGADIIGTGAITLGLGITYTNNGTIFGSGGPLPIELISFDARSNLKVVDLNWSTASEKNNDYFTIEKTKDGIRFDVVETIDGAGNSTSVLNYSTKDNSPYAGVSYYRLKQTDFNGAFTYSDLKMVDFQSSTDFTFDVYPNPNNGNNFNVLINADQGMDVLVVVYDAIGKKSYSKVIITQHSGQNVFFIDPSIKLSSGFYMISASSQQGVYNKKMIVK